MSKAPFVLVASEHGPLIVSHLDRHQISPNVAYGVGLQILQNGCYEPNEIQDILTTLKDRRGTFGDGLVAVDCGANIGVLSIEMAKYMRSFGQVISIEAQQHIFYALCGNVVLNNLFNVQAIYAAVGAEPGTMLVPKPDYAKPASFGSLELRRTNRTEFIGQSVSYAAKDMTRINVVSIDGLGLSRLDFLKIDVEGMEMDVLRGATKSLRTLGPDMAIEHIKTDRKELEDFLLEHNYSFVERGMNLIASPN